MSGKPAKSFTRIMFWVCLAEVLILVVAIICWMNAIDTRIDETIQDSSQAYFAVSTGDQMIAPTLSAESTVTAATETHSIVSMVNIDMNCDHIFEVFNGKEGIETSCRFCGVSQAQLFEAGIELPNEPCECEYETVIQTNGTPAYECKKCHNIKIKQSAALTELKFISDTNAKNKKDDVKYGKFYHDGREWEDMVRFWVIDKSGYTNSESLEVYLGNSYTTLVALAFAGEESDDDTDMTLRFYGDGELLEEINGIVLGAEESYAEIDVTDVEILKVECSTEVSAFGYCFLQGIAWY